MADPEEEHDSAEAEHDGGDENSQVEAALKDVLSAIEKV